MERFDWSRAHAVLKLQNPSSEELRHVVVTCSDWLHSVVLSSIIYELDSHCCSIARCRYASGATIQVLLFGVLAINLKKVAPSAHTVAEIVNARWGKAAHLTFLFFCFCANIIVTSMLLLGGAATVEALTGMDYRLASFLIPWGVAFRQLGVSGLVAMAVFIVVLEVGHAYAWKRGALEWD